MMVRQECCWCGKITDRKVFRRHIKRGINSGKTYHEYKFPDLCLECHLKKEIRDKFKPIIMAIE